MPIEEAVAGDLAAALVVPRLGELEVTLAEGLEICRPGFLCCVRLPLINRLLVLLDGVGLLAAGPILIVLRLKLQLVCLLGELVLRHDVLPSLVCVIGLVFLAVLLAFIALAEIVLRDD